MYPGLDRATDMAMADQQAMRDQAQFGVLYPVLVALTLLGFLTSLLTGPAAIDPGTALAALFTDNGGPETTVMREIRLPRAMLGALVGASLGLSGAAMQGLLRNPLAEPGLIGVSGSAALGAVLALQTGFAASFALALPLAALFGAAIAVALLIALAGPRGSSLVLNLSPNPYAAAEIVFWLMGSLADRSWSHVWLALPFMALGALALALTARGLDALTLGEDAAHALGISLIRLRSLVVAGTALMVGAATAITGAIGFVGLVVPHILRPLTGGSPARLLPASALGGAAMVLFADTAVQVILPERDLKLGVLTALIGAPIFLHLIYQTRKAGL